MEVAANWRPTLSTIPSTLLYAKIYLKLIINFPFDINLQNVRILRSLCKTNNERNSKENRRGRLNLKIKLKLKDFLSIFYTSISIWKWRMIDSKKRAQKKKRKKTSKISIPKSATPILPIYLSTVSTFLQYYTTLFNTLDCACT